MKNELNRRTFLTGLGAVTSAVFETESVLKQAFSANVAEQNETPKKVDALPDGVRPTLTVAHCCDPQLGFGSGEDPYSRDLAKLRREIDLLNEIRPDVVVFAGDMTHRREEATRDWPELLKTIASPILVAPGNHDVPDPVKKANVEAFRNVFGDDFNSLNINGWKIVAANSQYCRDTDETELYEAARERFLSELRDAANAKTPVILATHIPPFVNTLDEKDEYFNFPAKIRRDYLDFCVDSGVKFYLAGHTHTTLEREYRGVPILNGETTSKNFDSHSYGFRLLKIDAAMNYEWNFVALDR